jgi:hypothetical protein
MPFFEREGNVYLFIHIPKTGGSSIEAHIKQFSKMFFFSPARPVLPVLKVSPQHWPLSAIRSIFGTEFYKESFSIVRNPFKRLESEYHYQRRYFLPQLKSFDSWLKKSLLVCRDDPFYADNHFRPQVDFIDSTVRLYKYEDDLELIKRDIESRMGFRSDQQLPKRLYFEKGDVIHWTKESIDLVLRFYERDFKFLKYSSEP